MGLCYDCSEKALRGHTRCARHLKNNNHNTKALKAKWKEEGRCIRCGNPLDIDADRGCLKCINCREEIERKHHLCNF